MEWKQLQVRSKMMEAAWGPKNTLGGLHIQTDMDLEGWVAMY